MTMKYHALCFIVIFILAGCSDQERPARGINTEYTDMKQVLLSEPDSSYASVVKPELPARTITVGGKGSDIAGFTAKAIQTAIDALYKESRAGVIVLSPGEFEIIAPVRLYSNMTLKGSGKKTVLKKCKGVGSPLIIDADYGELQVTVKDASGFRAGMGISVYDGNQRYGWDLTTAKITAIKGNTLYFDEYLARDYSSDKGGTVSNACSVISAIEAENIKITDLIVDGSGDTNDMIDGCRAGGIYLHKVKNAVVENVIVKNFNSDGISYQITEHVTVRNCEVYGCTNIGIHPGTGSLFTVIEGNSSHDNGGYGLYVCWRVRNGVVRNNIFFRNGNNGISTGHKDTDMLFTENHIFENGSDGIYLRGETDLNAPHRSIFKNNIIENNGIKGEGYGISVNCRAVGVVLENNIIRNTGKGNQKAGVWLTKNSIPVEMKNNIFSGHPEGDVKDETGHQ